jgi:dissimilatory sulfite reductase (desulfoviridin) alpha/beta subunit
MTENKKLNYEKIKLENFFKMVVNNPKEREVILNAMKEWSNSATRVAAEKDLQKNIIADLVDKVGVEKKYLNKLATMYHNQNFAQFQMEREEIEELYESIVS